MTRPTPIATTRLVTAACLLAASCSSEPSANRSGAAPVPPTTVAGSAPETPVRGAWRRPLLDQAMGYASCLTDGAHVRVKARLQLDVAAAAVECGMPDAAARYAESIEGLQQGEALALAAQGFARQGDRERARSCLARALDIASRGDDGWMRDHLQTEVALACVALGDTVEARRHAAVSRTELTGRVEAALTPTLSMEALDLECDAFEKAISTGSMDIVRSGVDGMFTAWQRVGNDTARAGRCETAIRGALKALPIELQIADRVRLAEALAAAGRHDACVTELQSADAAFNAGGFTPDIWACLARDLAKAEARNLGRERGLQLLRRCVQRYERDPAEIPDLERGDALRPLAEGFAALDDPETALHVWGMALEAGTLNANGRPRARDLVLTCISLCRADVQPTPAMQRRIGEIGHGLKAPW